MLTTLVLLALLGALLLLTSGGRVRPFHITFSALGVILVGYARLAHESAANQRSLDIYLPGVIALVIGYLVVQVWSDSQPRPSVAAPSDEPTGAALRRPSIRAARRTAQVVVLLGIYHFAVVGIPVLSPNARIDRWSFTESGLFGLPGRAMNFGSVIVLALAFAVTRGADRRTARAVVLVPLLALTAFRFAGGFKGGMLQLLVQVAFIQLTTRPPLKVGVALRRYGALLLVALLFAAGVASLYQSTATATEGSSGLQLVFDRATLVPATEGSGLIELTDAGNRIAPTNTILTDFKTLTMEYLPGFGGERYQFTRVYSAYSSGRSTIGDQFIVPVAPQALPVLYYNFGLRAWAVMLIIGMGYGLLEGTARRAAAPTTVVACIVGCLALHYFLLKGDLSFQVINWSVMTAFVLGGYVALRTVFTSEAGASGAPPVQHRIPAGR